MFDGQQLGETIVAQVKGFMEREIAPLKAENESLKARIAALEARPQPEKGEDGKSIDPASFVEMSRTVTSSSFPFRSIATSSRTAKNISAAIL
jgi:hypothetical protein